MRTVPLSTLTCGARFALLDDDGSVRRTGTLLYANEYRARIKYDADARHVELLDGMVFDVPGRAVDVSPRTEVIPCDIL